MLPSGISVRIREDLIDGVSRTQTTLIIDPIITQGGHRVTMDDIGSIGYGKIDGSGPREEIISWTGITDNTTTYTLTGCVWGINFHNLEASADNTRRHTSGAKFEIKTDMHYITNQFRDNEDNVFTNTDAMEFNSNEIKLGDGTSALDKIITADNGDANEPFVKYNETSGKWEISNDGVNSYDPEDGGSGVTAGDAILIDGGAINVKTKETSGIHVTDDEVAIEYQTDPGLSIVDNKLGVKVKSGTGLLKDSDGIYNDSIDPDNIIPQTAGSLIGGTGHSDLSVFKDLANGTNDGKFKINVDGTVYDNVAISFQYFADTFIGSSESGVNLNQNTIKQVFNITKKVYTQKISFYKYKSYSGATSPSPISSFNLYNADENGDPIGDALVTLNYDHNNGPDGSKVLFDMTVNKYLEVGKYCLVISGAYQSNYRTSIDYGADNYITGNDFYINSVLQPNVSMYLLFTNDKVITESHITTAIQTAIQNETLRDDLVEYDTDHFKITSGHAGYTSQILKLMTPSSGTDISGAGATPYLDMADNATETLGTGEEYRLVMLNEDGKIESQLVKNNTGGNIVTSGRDLNTVYQNTTGKPIFVVASVRHQSAISSGVVQVYGKIGLTPSPNITVSSFTCSESGSSMAITTPHSFIVPVGYYYTIATVGSYSGSPALTSWFECDLI